MAQDKMEKTILCPRCDSEKVIKSGKDRGQQRYHCRSCSYYFVLNMKRRLGQSNTDQQLIALMYIAGAGNSHISHAIDRSYPVIRRQLEPIQEAVEAIPSLKKVRQPRKIQVARIKNPEKALKDTKKRWLMIEIESDLLDESSIVISKD